MPVKIVTTETRSKFGEIKQGDLGDVIDNFKKYVSITTHPDHSTILRTESFWFDIKEILKLLEIPIPHTTTYNGMSIYLGVHPNQPTCDPEENYSDHITAVLYPTKLKDGRTEISDSDFTLLPGFKSYPGEAKKDTSKDCCGGMKPPPPRFF